jgi:hypothetical protein
VCVVCVSVFVYLWHVIAFLFVRACNRLMRLPTCWAGA